MDKIKKLAADKLAYECAKAVQRRVIGTRSAIGDALLDYLEIGYVGGPKDIPTWMDAFENRAQQEIEADACDHKWDTIPPHWSRCKKCGTINK